MGQTDNKIRTNLLPPKKDVPFIVMLLPALIIVLIFSYLQMIGILVAFKDYAPRKGIFGSPWAASGGFQNFIDIVKTPGMPKSIWNTFYLSILSLCINFPAPVIFALLLEEVRSRVFKSTVQTISYLPYFLSWAAVTGMGLSLLSQYGIINDIIVKLGGERTIFLGDGKYFLPVYLIINVWKTVGWNSIVYLSAISGISQDLYEAARIDGAGRFKQVINITLPELVPTMMILLIMNLGAVFGSNFELVYGLQNDIAWNTEVISTVVYKYGIKEGAYGLSTALGLMQGVVSLILTLLANKLSDKISNVSMW